MTGNLLPSTSTNLLSDVIKEVLEQIVNNLKLKLNIE